MSKKNVILVDYEPEENWDFVKGLEKSTNEHWEIKAQCNNVFGNKKKTIRRYINYFIVAWTILLKRNQYKKIVSWQQFYGIALLFYFSIFNIKNGPEVSIMTFIYKEKTGIKGKIYAWFVNKSLSSACLKNVIVFSENEKNYYAELFNLPCELFKSEILGIDKVEMNLNKGVYYISAGRSNRDYDFLLRAWPKDKKIKIICDVTNLESTDSIEILKNCHDNAYYQELANAKGVIVPLMDENISSGQLVIIQSMMFGKPVIVTKNNTISNYVDNTRNGIVIEKSESCLLDALYLLENNDYYNKMSDLQLKTFQMRFTVFSMGERIGKYL